ncbi:hypothetical protein HY572_00390 [Candidatus Micrarchaeota archaeon]|nr:hypothetical protein [Candidatus Micrarchaeota archaeon]
MLGHLGTLLHDEVAQKRAKKGRYRKVQADVRAALGQNYAKGEARVAVEDAYRLLEQKARDMEEEARIWRERYVVATVHQSADRLDTRAGILREVAGHVLAIDWFCKFFAEADAAPKGLRRELVRRAPHRDDIFWQDGQAKERTVRKLEEFKERAANADWRRHVNELLNRLP